MMRNFFCLIAVSLFLLSCGSGKEEKKQITGQDTLQVALETLNKEIAGDGSNPDLYQKRARVYYSTRKFDLALQDINKAISFSEKPGYYITMSDIYLMMGQPQNASGALTKALELAPGSNEVLLALANLNLIIREYKTSMEYIRKSLEAEPVNNPRAFFLRGLVLLENGDTVSAVEDLKKSAYLDQNNYEAFLQLGELYSMKKDRMAVDYLKNALRVKPGNKEALYLLGMFYQETGKYDQALATYDSLKKVDTSYKSASYNEGYIYLVYLKQFDKAIKCFSDAITKDPTYAEAWYNRGYAYELSGDYANAARDYKRTLEIRVNYQKAIDALNRLDKVRK
ncbi:MAG: tetratricopeptide repeat protein [Syntrophothermus sp.]